MASLSLDVGAVEVSGKTVGGGLPLLPVLPPGPGTLVGLTVFGVVLIIVRYLRFRHCYVYYLPANSYSLPVCRCRV